MGGISALSINGIVVLRLSDPTGDSLSELLPAQAVQLARHLLSAAARASTDCATLAELAESLSRVTAR